jgi:hypothetical protein
MTGVMISLGVVIINEVTGEGTWFETLRNKIGLLYIWMSEEPQ